MFIQGSTIKRMSKKTRKDNDDFFIEYPSILFYIFFLFLEKKNKVFEKERRWRKYEGDSRPDVVV